MCGTIRLIDWPDKRRERHRNQTFRYVYSFIEPPPPFCYVSKFSKTCLLFGSQPDSSFPRFQLPNTKSNKKKVKTFFFYFFLFIRFQLVCEEIKMWYLPFVCAVQLCDAWCADATQQHTHSSDVDADAFLSIFR